MKAATQQKLPNLRMECLRNFDEPKLVRGQKHNTADYRGLSVRILGIISPRVF